MKLRFDADTPLYDGQKQPWRMDQCEALLDRLVARSKPLVVFVHGRGNEPNKSLNGATLTTGKAVPKIELGYDVSVLMFNWDSAFPFLRFRDRGRALSHTAAGAERFGELLQHLQRYFAARPALARPVLLAHSMGSIVLQKAVDGGGWPDAAPVFRQVVLSQPDADDIGHAAWLDRLGQKETVYVTWNADDRVLRQSDDERPNGAHALGLGSTQPLAAHCRYIDLTGMGPIGQAEDDDHEVFGKGAMNGQVFVCQFFEEVVRGRAATLDTGSNVAAVERDVVYRLKAHFDPKAPCLKAPKLP